MRDRESSNYFDNYVDLRFKELKSSMSLTLTPGFVGSYGDDDFDYNFEFNSSYSPTSDLVITTTVNPDFSIIESDGVNLNINSKYPVFYEEKRTFFIEKQNPWSSPLSIYNTRQIVEPFAGLKVSGKNGKDSYYLMGSLDKDVDQGRYYSNLDTLGVKSDTWYWFGNYKRNISDNIWLRPAISLRSGNSYESYNFSLDSKGRFGKNFSYDAQFVYSAYENYSHRFKKDQASTLKLKYDTRNWSFRVQGKSIGDGFESDLGHIRERDLNQLYSKIEYSNHINANIGDIDYYEVGMELYSKYDYDFDSHKDSGSELYLGVTVKEMINLWIGSRINYERLYSEDILTKKQWISISSSYFDNIIMEFNMSIGDALWYYYPDENGNPISSSYYRISPYLSYRISNSICISGSYGYRELKEYYTSHSGGVSVKYQFNKDFWFKSSFDLENVYFNHSGESSTVYDISPLFTYKVGTGTSFYFGGKININEADSSFDSSRDLKIFMKFTKAFDII
ncbi:MAG: hypothetical protein CSA15_06375 [Candidatus Delongbacteria bacterium]|nr:MAG: hypothetical protein CSA15_06375 [Candidatus Delongbacteria bacterium]